MPMSASLTARARIRAELTQEIKDAARRQLVESGAAALSLRAIAREMGMASSALYRYFPSRDDLLTALIVDAYEAVADATARAEAGVRRRDVIGRWMVTVRAVREWALAHPHEYALIFGSPVPGYQAPRDTIDPAARIPLLLVSILRDALKLKRLSTLEKRPMPRPVRSDLEALGAQIAPDLSRQHIGRAVMAWSQLIGMISFELFGHLHNVIHDYAEHFDYQMRGVAEELGLGEATKARVSA
jgi:AcrR family transcriptional regulator